MIRIMICDDEPKMLSDIAEAAALIVNDSEISAYCGGKELLSALGSEKCDILLLDIDMSDISGLDIAQSLSKTDERPLLIFVTSHDELVYDSLHFHPFGFVCKSYLEKELRAMLKDAVKELSGRDKHFCFRSADGNVKLRLDEILYFESDGNYIKLFAIQEEYRFRDTVTSIEDLLLKLQKQAVIFSWQFMQ